MAKKNGKTNSTGKNSFPIDTPTACRWKWAWSSLYLNSGSTSSCHRASFSTLTKENFQNFHNTPQKIQARQIMLDGQWPSGGCEYCKHIEDQGGVSDRIYQSSKPGIPPELEDGIHTHVTPVELEVFINNICNMKCIYCRAEYSSTLASEDKKFGYELNSAGLTSQLSDENFMPQFVEWYKEHGHNLQRLNILGGEPLYQKEFYKLLDVIEQYPNPQLELVVTTNLMAPAVWLDRWRKQSMDILKKRCVKRIDMQCSIDGLGTAAEYVRSGLDSEQWVKNFESFFYKSPYKMTLLTTFNLLVIDDIHNLCKQWKKWSEHKPVFWSIHNVLPLDSVLNIYHYDDEIYTSKIKSLLANIDNQNTYNLLSGILKSSQDNTTDGKLLQLKNYLQSVDHRRSSNWRDVFPWLTKYLESV